MIRLARNDDAKGIANIYNHYISSTIATFEEKEVSILDISARLAATDASGLPWLVSESDGAITGYAYASKWMARSAYRFCVEVSVYLAPQNFCKGIGSQLYEALFAALWERPYHIAIGIIALPNPASIALHEKFGMRQVAHFSEVGYKFDQWIDVGYWQGRLNY